MAAPVRDNSVYATQLPWGGLLVGTHVLFQEAEGGTASDTCPVRAHFAYKMFDQYDGSVRVVIFSGPGDYLLENTPSAIATVPGSSTVNIFRSIR